MSRIKEERFLSRLSEFASGRVGVSEFRGWLGQVLATEDFDLSSDHSRRISGKLSYVLHCASYLDMATDPEDSRHDQERARRLAASFALFLTNVESRVDRHAISFGSW